jgi:DNA polymerase III alpha subunit (gram-positive type)
MRLLCIDFETNGFPTSGAPRCDRPLPWSSYPIQVSMDFVADGVITHAYDSIIRGATNLAPWVRDNVQITLEQIRAGKSWDRVVDDIAGLLLPGDVMVAHKAHFDLTVVYMGTCSKLGLFADDRDDYGKIDELQRESRLTAQKILGLPWICSMTDPNVKRIFSGKGPSLKKLCNHLDVELVDAHNARADSAALAHCMLELQARDIQLTIQRPAVAEDVDIDSETDT